MNVTLWPTRQDAETHAARIGGTYEPVPGTSSWLAVPPGAVVPPAWSRHRATDPDTSRTAARSARVRDGQRKVLDALAVAGGAGLTDFELADRTGVKQTSIGKRRGELRDAGLVVDSGRRRPSDTGRPAIVWTLKAAG